MSNKDENSEINKDESLKGSESKPPLKKRGRPKKVKEEIPDLGLSEIKESAEGEEKVTEEIFEKQETGEDIIKESEVQEELKEQIPAEDITERISESIAAENENLEGEEAEEQITGAVPSAKEEKDDEVKIDLPEEKIKKKSNYQISLVDENHLRTRVLTNRLVSIFCSVKDREAFAEGRGERQTNKIFVHPKEKPQEIEIMVSIGSLPVPEEKKEEIVEDTTAEKIEKESNYQVSLVDENLLRVIIVTEKSVSVDCSVKDEDIHTDGSSETQANKIFIHPKDKPQEVEIIVSIGSTALIKETVIPAEAGEEKPVTAETPKSKLTPNPIVANLIHKFSDYPASADNGTPKTPEERLEEKLGPKNPWRLYKEMIQRNLIVGLVGAVMVYIIFVVTFYSVASKKKNNVDIIETPRLVVMQDLPENQFQQQNIEDPNKPPEEEKSDDGANPNKIPPIIPKKVKPPRVIGPPRQKVDTTSTADKELDSLKKINKNLTSDGTVTGDTTKRIAGNFPIPDSIMRNLNENEVGLVGRFPPYWKQIDSRTVNINEKEFSGVILVDTSVKKKEEALNMSVQIDRNSEYWKQYSFKNIFAEDSLKNVIYSIEPKQEGDQTYYRFYISGMAYNIYIASFINNEHFEKHKAEIEQVVRTIRIQKPATPPGK